MGEPATHHDYNLFDDRYLPRPFGLTNINVICWLNSTLQALLSCTALNKVVLELEEELPTDFGREYARLVRSIIPADERLYDLGKLASAGINIQRAFVKTVHQKYPQTTIGQSQECADEAFTLMVDLFDHPRIAGLFNNIYELAITCPRCQKEVSSIRDRTYKIDVFTPHALADAVSFTKYLRVHSSPVNSYRCPECEEVSSPLRIERLRMLREIVVLTFNKYHAKTARYFPAELVFPARGGGELRYRKVAQIEHTGGMSGGHYYASVLRGAAPRFHLANDSSIMPQELGPTMQTYMVMYHMVSSE